MMASKEAQDATPKTVIVGAFKYEVSIRARVQGLPEFEDINA